MTNKYDAIIIGAGMSGLAAGIRLAMYDKKVVILEKHSIAGGLNSYYARRIKASKEIINFDVGLHALTNFANKGERRRPFTKLLKQLRIPYDDFKLKEQTFSLIKFKSAALKFSNDFELMRSEIATVFPQQVDQFDKLVNYLVEYNETDLKATYISTRSVLETYLSDDLLKEMIIAPLLIYGSAWEEDMDFSQFVIMFKSIYLEGFSRPVGGVRTIIELLIDKYQSVGGELRFKAPVSQIKADTHVKGVYLADGEFLESQKIFSSAGLPETFSLLNEAESLKSDIGKMSFTESIIVTQNKQAIQNYKATIVFYNESDKYLYRKPDTLIDTSSAVFCLPDNYELENKDGNGTARITYMANYDLWKKLSKAEYLAQKENVYHQANKLTQKILGQKVDCIFKDVFSPTTIERYTGHFSGTVYGATKKTRDGQTSIPGLYIIGTDQGFLGIVGSMLSGISMSNLYGLMES